MRSIAIALAVVCGATSLSAQSRAADETAIRANAASIASAINMRDAVALGAFFTADADEINVDGPLNSGREAMRKAAEADLAKWPPTMRFTLTVTGIRFLGQDIAIVETAGRFNEGSVRATRGTWVSVRQGGKWLITALRVYPAQRPK